MRTIERNFRKIRNNNLNKSDYGCLVEAVSGKQYSRRRIYTYFIKLIDSDDYDTQETNQLVRYLHHVSKHAEECTFLTENTLQASQDNIDDRSIVSEVLVNFSRKSDGFGVTLNC